MRFFFLEVICQIWSSHRPNEIKETGQIWGFHAFSGERMIGLTFWHVDVSWPPSEVQNWLDFSLSLLIFPIFVAILTRWNGLKLRFLHIFLRPHGRNGLKFDMLMYPDYVPNWLCLGHSLVIFLILAQVSCSEGGQISDLWAFSAGGMEGMAWNLAWWCILTTFTTD